MNDTIASIATSLGVGAISIIRVSGTEAIKIVNKIFKGKDLKKVASHTIHYGHIINNEEIIDEVLVSVMKKPKTYTMEDVVEINCHGGIASTNKVLELLLLNGCRLASPGEFTKRAFLNGRIDLIEAEAVSDLINSETDLERKVAINGLEGNLSKLIKDIRNNLLNIISNIEVNIDYPEYQDIYEVTLEDLKKQVPNIKIKLEKLVMDYENTKLLHKGINVAIIGRPNVGKSSLLNKLLDENKAIVTNIPGTTRDIVEGTIYLDGIKLNIIDTAGIRETNDVVESIGVSKSLKALKNANLILLLLNNNEEITNEDKDLISKTNDKTTIIVINKNDLNTKLDLTTLNLENVVSINTIDNQGIDSLKNKIKELFNFDMINNSDFTYITNLRQITKIKEALNILNELEIGINQEQDLDILEMDLKDIWNTLGLIIGESYDEELLDDLFKNFCVGK
ncbi:MAG: tRNA uridine-5-carboxymethylaminomethyl(34) synthesis GTPase MnmE [Bacilli bacterium]|nr:tRNA uridine-5-carboxymethylaminomethyl(34) synthesis GTPase MnmE [Bacilli bacterium]